MKHDPQQPSAEECLQLALQHYHQNNLQQAEVLCKKALQSEPRNAAALHLLGVIAHHARKHDIAAALIRQAISNNPIEPDFHNSLGVVLKAEGRLDDAAACFRAALRLNSQAAEAHNNLGLVLQDQGHLDNAVACYQQAVQANPQLAESHYNLGLALKQQGKLQQAMAAFGEALRFKPHYAEAHNNLGLILMELGQPEEAISCCNEAVRLKPTLAENHNSLGAVLQKHGRVNDAVSCYQEALRLKADFPEAHNNLGTAFQYQEKFEEAANCYREALRLKPDYAEAHSNLGALLQEQGRLDDAIAQYGRALTLRPDYVLPRWGQCMAQIPILYQEASDILTSRMRYREALQALSQGIRLDSPNGIREAAAAVGGAQPFFLAYQGENDRELQTLYGTLVCRIQAARYPQWATAPPMPPHKPGDPLRVGIVSGFFRYHSNWKIPIKGWVENLDRRRVTLYGYHTGKRNDAVTQTARTLFTRFIENARDFEQLCRQIQHDRLHALIYPEVGMDPMTLRLAALRLAPVQCTSWGHPDTSGLPTLDYFLSSDLMEPPEADTHYSEQLVRFPNLSVFYSPPEIEAVPLDRPGVGVRSRAVLYLCVQSIYKYLPQYDDVFPRIAREVRDCQFVFLSFAQASESNKQFRHRLEQAFSRYGLRSEEHVVVLRPLDPPQYHALNRLSDIFLDSIGWSGCNSTLEAVACDLPVVTLPGPFMRGRHSFAVLSRIGVTETVARTLDEYVLLAVRLGKDIEWRRQIRSQIAENKQRLYRDMSCIDALTTFLEQAVANKNSGVKETT